MKKILFTFTAFTVLSLNAQSTEGLSIFDFAMHGQKIEKTRKDTEKLLREIPQEMRSIVRKTIQTEKPLVPLPVYKGQEFGHTSTPGSFTYTTLPLLTELSTMKKPKVLDGGSGAGDITHLFTLFANVDALELIPEVTTYNSDFFKAWSQNLYKSNEISEETYKRMVEGYRLANGNILNLKIQEKDNGDFQKLEVQENTYDLVLFIDLIQFLPQTIRYSFSKRI